MTPLSQDKLLDYHSSALGFGLISNKMKERCLEEGSRPDTIEEIKDMVVELSDELTENDIRRAVENIRKRAQTCLEQGDKPAPTQNDPNRRVPCPGGHFQHRMKHSPGH